MASLQRELLRGLSRLGGLNPSGDRELRRRLCSVCARISRHARKVSRRQAEGQQAEGQQAEGI